MRSNARRVVSFAGAAAVAGMLVVGCGGSSSTSTGTGDGTQAPATGASGAIKISGSSTVQPITTAVAEEFEATNKDVQITVDGPGTGDGFKVFCKGETDISNASRPIKKEEADACAAAGIEFIELKVANDGITVMTNPANKDVECLTKVDLYAIVGPESTGIKTWNDAGTLAKDLGSTTAFPSAPLEITAPGTESGTYDAFYELALQKEAEKRVAEGKLEKNDKGAPKEKTRADYTSQSNDNAILQAMEGSNSPFGWVGFAFAEEAGDKVKEIKIDGGKGCIAPSAETIADGTYPLSRALYIYVSKKSLASNKALQPFVDFYTTGGLAQVKVTGYVPLPQDQIDATVKVWQDKTAGSRDGAK